MCGHKHAHEDQHRLLAKEARSARELYNERIQAILLQLQLAKSAATADKEAKAVAIAAATKEERARIPVEHMYREENHDANEECILRKCSEPSMIEEVITRDDGTKEIINVCSIDHLNEYIQQREELIRWRAQQAHKVSQQPQGGAKQAKKAVTSGSISAAQARLD
jgi:hypothetical protein